MMNEAEIQRRPENRLIMRQLRDRSNPFNLPDLFFRKLYRFPRDLAHDLFLQLSPFLEEERRNTRIPKVVRFVVTLHFYSQGNYQKSVGTDRLCTMSQASVSKCINSVTNALVNNFSARLLRFPTTLEDIAEVKNGFFHKFNFPGIIGVVDGTHVSIVAPVFGRIPPRAVFLNRKNYYSLNCQLICDSNLKILGICSKYPGSVHDSAIWMMSNIHNELLNRFQAGDRNSWLIGDSGYPLQPFLLTPILDAEEGTPEGRYSRALCSARNCVERCIGVWKGTFRCLLKDRTLHYNPRTSAKIIIACASLYNILKNANVDLDEYFQNQEDVDNDINVDQLELHQVGLNTRNNLIRNHFQ